MLSDHLLLFSSAEDTSVSNDQSPAKIEDRSLQYLKELQGEKESLEKTGTKEILRSHALKLLENGNNNNTNPD